MDQDNARDNAWWASDTGRVSQTVGSSPAGLTASEASARLQQYGSNELARAGSPRLVSLAWRQISSPVVLILIGAAVLSFAMHDATDGIIILTIVLVSALLGFWQEFQAASAVASLQKLVAVRADVLRDGTVAQVALADVVPGDVVLLAAGSSIPADGVLIEARDLFVNEATLTGETFPVEKSPAAAPADAPLARRTNAMFQGTHVVSGVGRMLVVKTGRATQFGAIAGRLQLRPAETSFERGTRQFGMLLVRVTLIMVVLIFAFNVLLHRPVLDSFLFALALAVGLTPELLPAIISVNLARGAKRMAERKVIVKRLVSIENFGSMTVLCSDKTGTLTEGKVKLDGAMDTGGQASARALFLANLNAAFQTGFNSPIDAAIVAAAGQPPQDTQRLDEIPYDFTRKRLSVLAEVQGHPVMITKGALAQILAVCTEIELPNGDTVPFDDARRAAILAQFAAFSARGIRTLGLAIRNLPGRTTIAREDETGMTLAGFLLVSDPPKQGIAQTISELRSLGVALKIITGDNALVARAVASQVGLANAKIITGQDLRQVSDDALPQLASRTDIFAEVEPNQKESIIRALQKAGKVVGYMGDGINDGPALHAADVGLAVQGAADVAQQAADIVLLEPELSVLIDGVREGRTTFANTQKYIFMATSANFGNMFSMAAASLVLPFLPLLPKQILLTNLLTDLPEMTIATDRVDESAIEAPQKWELGFIRRFMIWFGLLSSVFDLLTFAVLFLVLRASPELFRTGWFVESVVSAALVVLVVRTRGPFWKSRPSRPLTLATLGVVGAVIALPYTALGPVLGFAPLPWLFLLAMGLIVAGYLTSAELLKRAFWR